MPYGLLSTGFVKKPQSVIDAEVEQALRAISELIVLEADDPFGEAVLVLTGKVGELWEVAEALNASQDPDQNGGAAQDGTAALTGTRRRAATKSKVTATVNLDDGTSIAVGDARAYVTGNPSAIFANTETMVNNSGEPANVLVEFEAEEAGAVAAPANTLQNIVDPIAGWNSIDNTSAATLGAPLESDAQLRLRREQELAAAGGCTDPGMTADLSQVSGVTSVQVWENWKSYTDSEGRPQKSFECVVVGGTDADIAKDIWEGKPLGIETYGLQSQAHVDSEGVTQTVFFTRPTTQLVGVAIELFEVGPDYPGDVALKQAIYDLTSDPTSESYLGVGDDVFATMIACIVRDNDGIDFDVSVASTTILTVAAGSRSVVIGSREIASIEDSEGSGVTIIDST
ncbi:MAG: hypothetical protein GWN84_20575 [Gammaproteobacteria bacterium]|nr:hypothetical protein [Gammaproteobacteria bacterium]NIR85157.1 hypothetical protein [Gammaproteobacteria bacterium]NIU06206.1 hypothetical protein [Gammaproteobacteria bacterium]NIX87479.1 hypothetical protein [Gammaproteobacteria bacterium]